MKSNEDLKCRVCGAPAHGYNFDQISCESCKAFFRRNALRNLVSQKLNRCRSFPKRKFLSEIFLRNEKGKNELKCEIDFFSEVKRSVSIEDRNDKIKFQYLRTK